MEEGPGDRHGQGAGIPVHSLAGLRLHFRGRIGKIKVQQPQPVSSQQMVPIHQPS